MIGPALTAEVDRLTASIDAMTTALESGSGVESGWEAIRLQYAAILLLVMHRGRMSPRLGSPPPISLDECRKAMADGRVLVEMLAG